MRALVTGATGFVGRNLMKRLEKPVVLSRNPQRAKRTLGDVEAYAWEPQTGPPPAEAFRGIDVVFSLAGENVADGRWTAAKKQRIRESRVAGTRNLVAGLEKLTSRPGVLVSASAVGFYGSRGDELLDENSSPGNDFLAEVSKAWEAEAGRARLLGARVVMARIGIVLGKGGGVLAKMLTPFKLGLGGRLGSGRQWTPWVHMDDLVELLLHAAQTRELSGPMNGVAPNPVTNRELTQTLARILRRPAIFPVPEFVLRGMLGEFGEAILSSQRVAPRVAEKTGYRFRHQSLEEALRAIL